LDGREFARHVMSALRQLIKKEIALEYRAKNVRIKLIETTSQANLFDAK
jgi:hypothetical protein